jgi:integrase
MADSLVVRNGETVEIDSIITALEATPDKTEILEALKGLRSDKVKAALGETVRAAQFECAVTFEDFLNDGEKADATRVVYRREIGRWLDNLDRLDINVLQADRATVNRFKAYMADRYAANTVRVSLAACSSFYTYLEDEQYIQRSPFAHIKYPRKVYKKAVRPDQEQTVPVMNDEEYAAIVTEIERRMETCGDRAADMHRRDSARRLLPIVHMMAAYGLRIADVMTVRLEGAYFSVRTKGGSVRSFELLNETIEILENVGLMLGSPFDSIGKSTIQNAVSRITGELSERDIIRHRYSCHDFRHYFAVNLYRETHDVYAVKEALGHATASISKIYLAGLGAT